MARKAKGPFKPHNPPKAKFAFTPKPAVARYYMDSKGCWYTDGKGRHTRVPLPNDLPAFILSAVAP